MPFIVGLVVGTHRVRPPNKPFADTFDVIRTHAMCPYGVGVVGLSYYGSRVNGVLAFRLPFVVFVRGVCVFFVFLRPILQIPIYNEQQ